jgi:hypothetical protein
MTYCIFSKPRGGSAQANTTIENFCSNGIIFLRMTIDKAIPIVGVLRTHETSHPYKWHSRGG